MASVAEQGHIDWQASADEAAGRLGEAGAPGLRFTYSYAINAIPLLGRALSEAIRRAPENLMPTAT